MGSLILAIRFLTVFPLPGREAGGPGALGRAAWWFPLVGLALGAVLALADRGLSRLFPPLVSAVLVLALWKVLTGGIHLDGLADCLDGLAGRDPEQRRAIMRDARIGVFGAVGLILALASGVASVSELPDSIRSRVLVLAPAVGRTMPLVIGWSLRRAAGSGGLGAEFASGVTSGAMILWLPATLFLTAHLLWPGGWLLWVGA
ncbi:MAG TPA: adenosylcobinamide-GDP ribazoletransferase, partial [Methylomirabilota bacterium]|nr:adenosylcobinamide-GDP ribazoletransferase [Methylomirabilota bacterium]